MFTRRDVLLEALRVRANKSFMLLVALSSSLFELISLFSLDEFSV